MSRVKLSEYRAKNLLFDQLGLRYGGVSIDLTDKDYKKLIDRLPDKKLYVSKVDQGIKKRGKNGLVNVKRTKKQLIADLNNFAKQGFRYALIEPFVHHEPEAEAYLALSRTRNGIDLSYSDKGGIEIESNAAFIEHTTLADSGYEATQNTTGLNNDLAAKLYDFFQANHMTFLEINPYVEDNKKYLPLDAAVEVDSSAQFFVGGAWDESDTRAPAKDQSEHEIIVEVLNAKSPASLSLKILNPDGSIFLLLSGGGASVVVADELAYLGRHKKIGNYGEYSGNPNEDETYAYTKEILRLMLDSKAAKKVLIIAGGVANFTDVAKTFHGIIRAMSEVANELKEQGIQVFVRRGGPNQEKGLAAMDTFLNETEIKHEVYGPEKSLAQVVARAARAAG